MIVSCYYTLTIIFIFLNRSLLIPKTQPLAKRTSPKSIIVSFKIKQSVFRAFDWNFDDLIDWDLDDSIDWYFND
ncbi:hypothetical protein PGT21_023010 [Puccinia graminis f. sp. tritici]|uniref:Uncharacterized protein n=1 Tax=Puccinia graminis f. sp. tritici TaxID=56615 RepID=A0A5B0MKV6_PUCGR|nr:hypothetical protein PGT21_023010 [Puccinia graminis f. sp. tritici]KAA1078863.1 hypothetical protein PGTUg99_010879 [Puccinia graminis f. sp. tritici]